MSRIVGAIRWVVIAIVLAGCGWLGAISIRTWRASSDVAAAQALALSQGSARALPYLARAAHYRPGQADAWRLRAEFSAFAHPHQALRYARRAVAADPADWQNWRQLGVIEYQLGDAAAATRALAQAAQRDSGWAAHYQLGNLALLLGREQEFWAQMKASLAIVPAAQAAAVLNQAWAQTSGDAQRLLAILPQRRVELDAEAATVIMNRGAPLAAARLWGRVQCPRFRYGACRGAVLGLTNRLVRLAFAGTYPGWSPPLGVAAPDRGALARAAMRMWNRAARRGIIDAAPARTGTVGDGRFARPWIGPAFAWFKSGPVYLSREPGDAPVGAALRIGFDGYQPEQTGLIGQIVPVMPNAEYSISFLSRRAVEGTDSGLALAVQSAPGVPIVEIPAQLGMHWRASGGTFRVPRSDHLVLLAFQYHRPMGQVRMHAPALVADVRLQEVAP